MKKIIPFFAFALVLRLSLLAVSISSSKIDTFMTIPDWMPASVDAEYTFGSDAHSNATHRVTSNTLAAVESVFEAYHERTFYASEGESLSAPRRWDERYYGPNPSAYGLQDVWFTNTLRSVECYVYPHAGELAQRSVRDTRRLVELRDLWDMGPYVAKLFERADKPFLGKGDAWGSHRDIAFGSSWGPGSPDLPEDTPGLVRDRNPTKEEIDLENDLVPLYCCRNDSFFIHRQAEDEHTDWGYLASILADADADLHVLVYDIDMEGGRPGGFLGRWRDGAYTNAAWMKMSVPGVITNLFPNANPEFAMSNFTRRLVQDDFLNVSTNYVVKTEQLGFGYAGVLLSRFRPNGTHGPAGSSSLFTVSDLKIDIQSKLVTEFALHEFPNSGPEVTWWLGPEYGVDLYLPDGTTRADTHSVVWVDGIAPYAVGSYITSFPYSQDSPGWMWLNPDYGYGTLQFPCYRVTVITNETTSASSLVATESRALAMLDRTYERPFLSGATNEVRRTLTNRVFRARYGQTLRKTVTLTGKKSGDGCLLLDHPQTIDNFNFTDTTEYTVDENGTGTFGDVNEPPAFNLEFAKFSGTDGSTSISVVSSPLVEELNPIGIVFGSRLLEELHRKYQYYEPGEYFLSNLRWECYIPDAETGNVWASLTYGISDEAGGTAASTESVFFYDAGTIEDYEFPVYATASVSLSAVLTASHPEPKESVHRLYSPVGPGPYGVAAGVAELSKELFYSVFAERYAWERDENGFPLNKCVTIDQHNALPLLRYGKDEHIDSEIKYKVSSGFEVSSTPVSTGRTALDALAANAKANRDLAIRSVFDRVGVGGVNPGARDVVPVFPLRIHFGPLLLDRARINDIQVDNRVRPLGDSLKMGTGMDFTLDVYDSTTRMEYPLPEFAALFYLSATLVGDGPQSFGYGFRHSAAASIRTSPVIVTDWNWKALKSTTNK